MSSDILHVYVVNQYPSYSETFIENEIKELLSRGGNVLVYSLTPGEHLHKRSEYFLSPISKRKCLLWLIPGVLLLLSKGKNVRNFLHYPHISRSLYASCHSARIAISLRQITRNYRSLHFHAHFLDRPADVVAMLPYRKHMIRTVMVHGADSRKPKSDRIDRERLEHFDGVLCSSEFVAKNLVETSQPKHIEIAHCGIDFSNDHFNSSYFFPINDVVIITTVARLIPSKGIIESVPIVKSLNELGFKVRWHIIGDGPLREKISKEADSLRSSTLEVEILGALPNDVVLNYINHSHIFILLSQARPIGSGEGDGIPVALMEAMASFCLVVSNGCAGIPELIKNDENGFLYDNDPALLAKKISVLLSNPDKRDKVLNEARKTVEESFSMSKQVDIILKMLKSQTK
jgi:colanic acid/amylovoran biosynthesis glycosyltransferase